MKNLIFLAILNIFILFLAGCANFVDNGSESKRDAINLQSSVSKVDDHTFKYVIKNISEKNGKLSFDTGQEFNYVLSYNNVEKTVVVDYSDDKIFSDKSNKKIIKPGEELVYEIVLDDLEPENYILEVYLNSNEPKSGNFKKFYHELEFSIK